MARNKSRGDKGVVNKREDIRRVVGGINRPAVRRKNDSAGLVGWDRWGIFLLLFCFFCLSYFPSPSNRICSAPLFPDPSLLISDFSVADIGQRLWEMQLGNGKDPPGGLQVWYQLFRMYVEVYVTEARLRIRNLGVFVCCHSMFRI